MGLNLNIRRIIFHTMAKREGEHWVAGWGAAGLGAGGGWVGVGERETRDLGARHVTLAARPSAKCRASSPGIQPGGVRVCNAPASASAAVPGRGLPCLRQPAPMLPLRPRRRQEDGARQREHGEADCRARGAAQQPVAAWAGHLPQPSGCGVAQGGASGELVGQHPWGVWAGAKWAMLTLPAATRHALPASRALSCAGATRRAEHTHSGPLPRV